MRNFIKNGHGIPQIRAYFKNSKIDKRDYHQFTASIMRVVVNQLRRFIENKTTLDS